MKIECPRCNQDWVLNARIKVTGESINVCPECEASWPDGVHIAFETFVDMSTMLKAKGLAGEWKDLEVAGS